MKKRLVVIGLDGSRLDFISKWAESGYLPNFKKMIDEGVSGVLKSVLPGPHSFPAWTSCFTGVNPGKHGMVYPIVQSGKDLKFVTSLDIKKRRVWNYLSDHGKFVGVFDFPGLYPVDAVNGVMVSSCGTPIFAKEYTYPSYLKTLIDSKFAGRQIPNCHYRTKSHLDNLYDITNKKFELWNWFLENNNWDFFTSHIIGTEMLHHIYPSFMDSEHKQYDSSFEVVMRDYYVHIDKFLGSLISKYADSDIMLISDHGFCLNKFNLYVNNILENHGYFVRQKKSDNKLKSKVVDFLTMTYLKIPSKLRYFANHFIPSFAKNFRIPISLNIDWDDSLAFSHFMGTIYVNRNSKKISSGMVKVSDVVDKIIHDLETSEFLKGKIIKIYRKEELFNGSRMEDMPDIIPIYNNDYRPSIKSPVDILFDDIADANVGSHTMDGLFIARGPSFKNNITLNDLNIIDITPTILHMFDIPVPYDMDGKVLVDIFNVYKDIKISTTSNIDNNYSGDMTTREEEEIKKALKDMGYI